MVALISSVSIVLLVIIDQLIKFFVVEFLKPAGSFMFIKGFLQFTYVENTGAMMGFMKDKTLLMTIMAILVLVLLLVLILTKKIRFGFEYCCIIMIAAGGIGNIIDRIFRGFDVDYIEVLFVDFYVFNFADCLVTVGAFLIVFYEIYDLVKEMKQKKVESDG